MHATRWPAPQDATSIALSLPARGRFWLDGQPGHPEGRWTFLGAAPAEVVAVPFGDARVLDAVPRGASAGARVGGDAIDLSPSEIPWWVGYVAYDAAWSEAARLGLRKPARLPRPARPVLWLGRYESLVAIDRVRGETFVLAPDAARGRDVMRSVRERVAPRATVGAVAVEDAARHRSRIVRALEAIRAGEIYQVNLARRWTAPYAGSPLALWLAMRETSPVPLGAYLELEDHAVLARTMERFLRWHRPTRRLWTSPIKGTIARSGRDDAGEADRLTGDDKERAEHSMIVDLMRNDLSRVAEVGSVRVREPLRVEPFAGLSHLVSTVECRTRAEVDAAGVLEATFPPGSITGTPKLRAMELIEAEEAFARGVYTGAVGYLDRSGGWSLAVAIRTAVVAEGAVEYFAGGGLVSASDPDREIAETELKAKVFLDAVERLSRENVD